MMLLASLVAATAAAPDLEALDRAIGRCDRALLGPAFAAEAARRSNFLTEAYREQEQIVAERLDIAERRRALRETGGTLETGGTPETGEPAETEDQLSIRALAVEDRQRALDDRRLLENLRQDAMDAKRRVYLTRCASGRDRMAD